ncbi:MAG: rhomboid family intramembrane serine protease [Deltaproteobacteria bacterium]|nr:rhomboid family intramembrane serine protease [Deltaproteobacteria bacterium]
MFIPLSDAPNPKGIPFVNYALILANVAVYLLVSLPLSMTPADPGDPALQEYLQVLTRDLPSHIGVRQILAQISQYDLFVFEYGFRPAAPNLEALFLSLFLHAGFLHLFGNMLFLWIYGDNIEIRLGRWRYLIAYLSTGVAATLFHAVVFRTSMLPLVGASGAISGVLGFYFVWFPRNRVRMLMFFFPFVMRVIELPARLVLGFYILLDNLLPFLLSTGTGGSGVAFGAHIGGFFAGLIAARWINHRQLMAPDVAPPAAEPADPIVLPADADPSSAIKQAIAYGDMLSAARAYLALDPRASRYLLEAPELLQLANWLASQYQGRAALAVYLRLLRDYPSAPAAAAAHLGAGIVQLEQLGEITPAFQHFVDALDLNPSPDVAAAARAALDKIAARQKRQIGPR